MTDKILETNVSLLRGPGDELGVHYTQEIPDEYLQQLAALAGLRHYPQQGPWNKKSGSAVGTRDNYITAVGFAYNGQAASLVILLRFKKSEQPELVSSALKNANLKKGKPGAVGSDFVRWEWKYSFTKPKAEEVAKLIEDLRAAIKPVTMPFDGRCEKCASTSTNSLTLLNGMPMFICATCQEKVQHELNQAAEQYEMITPNYPNGLVLGLGAAALGGLAWGLLAYGLNRIFLYGAILIGFASYLLVFTTLLNILRDYGFDNLRSFIGVADGYAYLALMVGWAYAAWVPARRPVLALDVLRRLQLETV